MIVDLLINSVEYPLQAKSLVCVKTLNQRATADFSTITESGPWGSPGNDVALFRESIRFFGGLIQDVTREAIFTVDGGRVRQNRVKAIGYEWLLDRRTVGNRTGDASFVAQHANDIIRELVTSSMAGDGISIADIPVGVGPIIDRLEFDEETVAEAVSRVCQLAGYRGWFVDANKKLQLRPSGATFSFDHSKVRMDGMSVRETREQYANRLTVILGAYLLPESTETFSGSHPNQPTNGSRTSWLMPFPIAQEPVVSVNSATQTVGILGVDSGKDWYWNLGSSEITQDPGASELTSTDVLSVTYIGQTTTRITVEDAGQIAARAAAELNSGVYHVVLRNDQPVRSFNAEQLAQSYLDAYNDVSFVLTFESIDPYYTTVNPGDIITVPSGHPADAEPGDYTVRQVTLSSIEGNDLRVRIECVKGPLLLDGIESLALLAGDGSGAMIAAAGGAASGGFPETGGRA